MESQKLLPPMGTNTVGSNWGRSGIMEKVERWESNCVGRGDMVPETMTAVHFHKMKINTVGILIIPQTDNRMIAPE